METDRVVLAWLKKLIVKSRRKNESAETIDEMIASKLKEFPHVAFAGGKGWEGGGEEREGNSGIGSLLVT